MGPIFGEYECKLDEKGRFLLPSALLKQLPEDQREEFVLNRGLDPCLVLYPMSVWREELRKIHSKNQYVAKNRAFARKFQSGATPANPDSNRRLLIPKRLMSYAGIERDLVLIGAFDRIEIWGKERYEEWLEDDSNNLEKLSEEVMAEDADQQNED
jgi:MraZ protein